MGDGILSGFAVKYKRMTIVHASILSLACSVYGARGIVALTSLTIIILQVLLLKEPLIESTLAVVVGWRILAP